LKYDKKYGCIEQLQVPLFQDHHIRTARNKVVLIAPCEQHWRQ